MRRMTARENSYPTSREMFGAGVHEVCAPVTDYMSLRLLSLGGVEMGVLFLYRSHTVWGTEPECNGEGKIDVIYTCLGGKPLDQ